MDLINTIVAGIEGRNLECEIFVSGHASKHPSQGREEFGTRNLMLDRHIYFILNFNILNIRIPGFAQVGR